MPKNAEPVHPDSPRGQLDRIYSQALSKELPDALDVLDAIAGLREALDRQEDDAAMLARRAGATWQQIGDALGITRQRAHQRWAGATDLVGWGPATDENLPTFAAPAQPRPDDTKGAETFAGALRANSGRNWQVQADPNG